MVSSCTYTLSNNVNIFFTDSGAPPGSRDYTTLVLLHGSAFTGDTFEKLHALAHRSNLRTIIWNRRDYPGSTRYSDDELQELHNGEKTFLDRLATEMGEFLLQFIEKEAVPKISPDRKLGGFAILGWSMGTTTAMALFADANLLSRAEYNVLESYVKDLIFYDPPFISLGIEVPDDANPYDPWVDPEYKTAEELYENFRQWVTGYYNHPSCPTIYNMDFRKRSDQRSCTSWTPEQWIKYYDEGAAVRSELKMYTPPMSPKIKEMAQSVLFDESVVRSFFPQVPVTYMAASRSTWHCIWSILETKRIYQWHSNEGHKTRQIRFFTIEGGNHFVHYDNPESLITSILASIRA
ncbi:Alpha/Beta hydrolase protein [Armillaria luteobubalina]|uniref:Alpha/Beta hydrolase protein n=1 Tax=Armillaria luteobubalina TaxID=153913 RepID=A0AA39Q8B7_9AGAR|nr:Alpha/Beta hydrolase protein [Armillaria luteobubalina]